MVNVEQPKSLMIIGSGASAYDAGEIWHLFDQRYEMPITLVEKLKFKSVDLYDYNTLILVSGNYTGLPVEEIKKWVKKGGTIIGFKTANNWLRTNQLLKAEVKPKITTKGQASKLANNYENQSKIKGAEVIGGAIFETEIDLTHPLAYGYTAENIPIFRRGTLFFNPSPNPIATPLRYTKDALLSGYISVNNLATLNNSASIIVSGSGSGRVIGFADNTNFRAFWYGTNKLFANAVFFGRTISGNGVQYTEAQEAEAVEEGH